MHDLMEQIESEAVKLKAVDRARLAERLLESLDSPDEKVERLWIAESEARYQAFKEGKVEGTRLDQFVPRRSK